MRRPRFRRSSSSKFTMPEYTAAIPPSPTRLSLRNRDTGFAEPFCGSRNTSLPHPEANLAPDACITEEDVNPARALLRYRASFLAQQADRRNGVSGSHFRNVSSSSTATSASSSSSSDEGGGTIAALGRLAISSIRAGEMPRLDAFLGGHREEEEEEEEEGFGSSDGMSSRDPDSPPHLGSEFGRVGGERREEMKEARGLRRRGSFIGRLIHR